MVKPNITKRLLLSILVSGLVTSCSGKSTNNQTVSYNAKIEEINNFLSKSNQLQRKYSLLDGRLSIFAKNSENSDEASQIIQNTVGAITSDSFVTESNTLSQKICQNGGQDCPPEIKPLVEQIQTLVSEIKATTTTISGKGTTELLSIRDQLKLEDKFNEIETNLFKINSELIKLASSAPGSSPVPYLSLYENIISLLNFFVFAGLLVVLIMYLRKILKSFNSLAASNSKSLSEKSQNNSKDNETNISILESINKNLDSIYQSLSSQTGIKINLDNLSAITTTLQNKRPKESNRSTDNNDNNLDQEALTELLREIIQVLSNIGKKLDSPKQRQKGNYPQKSSGKIVGVPDLPVEKSNQQISQNLSNRNQETQKPDQELAKTTPKVEISSLLRNPADLNNLVNHYNRGIPRVVIQNTTTVDATSETIEGKRSGTKLPMLFKAIDNGSYWIVNQPPLKNSHYFLVPQAGLVINDANYYTVESIFECVGYKNRQSNKFELISPAIVKALFDQQWQLIETGKLIFR